MPQDTIKRTAGVNSLVSVQYKNWEKYGSLRENWSLPSLTDGQGCCESKRDRRYHVSHPERLGDVEIIMTAAEMLHGRLSLVPPSFFTMYALNMDSVPTSFFYMQSIMSPLGPSCPSLRQQSALLLDPFHCPARSNCHSLHSLQRSVTLQQEKQTWGSFHQLPLISLHHVSYFFS